MDLTRIQALIQRYGSRLDLPRSTLNTLSDIALSALGSTWLGGHITTANRISNKPEYRHPLIRDLVGAAPEIGIAELVEKGYEILEKRINRKLKQTKTSESTTRRMLFVELPTGLQGPSASAHHRLFADADRRFGGVAALVLTHRRPSRWKRFAYQGVLLQGTQESGIPDELYRRLNEVELGDIFS
jgi:hypothetical protein